MRVATLSRRFRNLVRNWLSRSGWELKRIPDAFFIEVHEIDLVVDVGANRGQFARALRREGYRGRIVSFEPLEAPFAALSALASRDPLWTAVRTAVGAEPGEAGINVSLDTAFSSIKPIRDSGVETRHPGILVEHREVVPVARLDDLLEAVPGWRVFLKIDTQGFEQEVLAGAPQTLERVEGMMLELPIEHLYSGVWSFVEALTSIERLGFVPAQFREVSAVVGDRASALELDSIFRRKTSLRKAGA